MDLTRLSDETLLARLDELAQAERKALPHLLACLAEVDRRGAYKRPGFPTLFEYCTSRLRYSEDVAYRRIHASRAAARFPEIYSLLADGNLSLSAVSKLAPHLTAANAAELLSRAQGRDKRAIEELLSGMFPRPDTADRIRVLRIPAPAAASSEGCSVGRREPDRTQTKDPGPTEGSRGQPPAAQSDASTNQSPARFQFSFTGSRALREAIDRARDLLWHKHPWGRLEDILLDVVRDYLERHDPQLQLDAPRSRRRAPAARTRTIPAWIRAKVWARDGGRCSYISPDGRRCQARRALELDHIHPRALGGRSDDPENIRLLCRAHNDFERRRILGEGTATLPDELSTDLARAKSVDNLPP